MLQQSTTYHNAYPFLVNNQMLFTKSTIAPQFKKYLPKQVSNWCPTKTTSCTKLTMLAPQKSQTLTPISLPSQALLPARPN